ncbi:hypothetical protein SLEP1_g55171 [Rubroshorea leprosula]|uniref:Uncharacterized protein n=1 Tax=Rubroshorea leprosula TaxID=152421 RepID=A0AAV5MFF7_9ROSI|nr:hypothetical protein SLEP1_g55171 [Rubroshorea leprosula]
MLLEEAESLQNRWWRPKRGVLKEISYTFCKLVYSCSVHHVLQNNQHEACKVAESQLLPLGSTEPSSRNLSADNDL